MRRVLRPKSYHAVLSKLLMVLLRYVGKLVLPEGLTELLRILLQELHIASRPAFHVDLKRIHTHTSPLLFLTTIA